MILMTDTETTDLLVDGSEDFIRQPGIVQVAMIKLDDDFNEIDRFQSLVNPEIAAGAWGEKAIATHGIKPEDVIGAPTFYSLFPAIAGFARGCRSWGGYNIRFDKRIFWFQLRRYGFEMNFPWPPHEIEVMDLVKRRLELRGRRDVKPPKLADAYQLIVGKPMQDAHDALADVSATAEILRHLMAQEAPDYGEIVAHAA
jgi:DNA polymerase III epsilon subunit-like protein